MVQKKGGDVEHACGKDSNKFSKVNKILGLCIMDIQGEGRRSKISVIVVIVHRFASQTGMGVGF